MPTPTTDQGPGTATAKQTKWVCYYRVSTQRQGQSGLGLEAQHETVRRYIAAHGGTVVAEFTETESGKKASNRPELLAALALCRKERATLCIAKLDRLARNLHFISGLIETRVGFVAADMPSVQDPFMLQIYAAVGEQEARLISTRTKEALAAAKRRGVVIGATGRERAKRLRAEAVERALALAPTIAEIQAAGHTLFRQIRDELNRRGIPSPGGGKWHLSATHRTLQRIVGSTRIRTGCLIRA